MKLTSRSAVLRLRASLTYVTAVLRHIRAGIIELIRVRFVIDSRYGEEQVLDLSASCCLGTLVPPTHIQALDTILT